MPFFLILALQAFARAWPLQRSPVFYASDVQNFATFLSICLSPPIAFVNDRCDFSPSFFFIPLSARVRLAFLLVFLTSLIFFPGLPCYPVFTFRLKEPLSGVRAFPN